MASIYLPKQQHIGKKKGDIVCQFFGYHNTPSWSLNENYSKWTLTLYKPWIKSTNELKAEDDTFKTTLEKFMYNSKLFPDRIRTEILRAKRKEIYDVQELVYDLNANQESKPTSERDNPEFEDHYQAALSPVDDNKDEGKYEDMAEFLFDDIENRPAFYDWSQNYVVGMSKKLDELARWFYKAKNESVIVGLEEELKLFEIEKHIPENCCGEAQKFLVYHHLYHHYMMQKFDNKEIQNRPPSQFVLVEGKPRTGKTFITKTLRNIKRFLTKSNSSDIATAPAGCAAVLIDGSTHFRTLYIPSGSPLYQQPTDIKTTQLTKVRALKTTLCKAVTVIEDEHSMKGRPIWGWSRHRYEELRRPSVVMDNEQNIVHTDDICLSPEVYSRPWGGLPFLYSFGHCGQLPPVLMKSMYDKSPAKTHTADHKGKIAIQDFLHPNNDKECQSTVVVMNEVLR